MKQHILKHDSITICNWPFSENDIQSIPFECSEEDYAAYQDGTLDFDIVDGTIITKPSTRKADREAAEAAAKQAAEAAAAEAKHNKIQLLSKVTAGTATAEEIAEFANLI